MAFYVSLSLEMFLLRTQAILPREIISESLLSPKNLRRERKCTF